MKRLSEEGFNVTEQEVRIKDLNKADEIWVTSSTKEIQPVHQVDNMVLPEKELEEVQNKLGALDKALIEAELIK